VNNNSFDILIIGGGINGCGIAHELAARGYSVCLAEKNDIASATSSWSTKLIHGGLRYLERYEFRLVRESLKEREVLIRMAPHEFLVSKFYCAGTGECESYAFHAGGTLCEVQG